MSHRWEVNISGRPTPTPNHPRAAGLRRGRDVCVHLVDEVPDVSRVWHDRSDWVLGLWDDGPLVHPADSWRFADDVLQGVWLLQLAQIIVLLRRRGQTERSRRRRGQLRNPVLVCVCVCLSGAHLVLLSPSLLIVFEDVVSDIIFRVDEQLLGLPLLLSALHPQHKQQHHACDDTPQIY